MATLQPGFFFTGTLGNISAYKMKGTDKIILRQKGGPAKKKIQTSARFERTRENISEFSGRSVAARLLRRAMQPVAGFADHNLVNSLQPLFKKVQEADLQRLRGQRHVCLSQAPHLLQGYSLNRRTHFDSVVRSPVVCTLSRDTLSATLELPALVPGINFFPHRTHPLFSLVLTLGIMPGVYYNNDGYRAPREYDQLSTVHSSTEWQFVDKGCAARSLQLSLPAAPAGEHVLVVTVGICFGSIKEGAVVAQEPYSGLGKVVGVG